MSPSPRACIARLDIVDGCTSFQKKNHLQFSTANGSFFFYCTPCDWSASNLGFLRKYEKNWPLSWWLVNAVSFCAVHGANLPVSLSNAVRKLCGVMAPALPAALSCRFPRGYGYRLCRASGSKLNGAVNAGSMSLLLPHSNWRYTPPQPRELVWQVLCRGACSKLTHQRFELNFRGVIPYIGEQPCAKVKERAVSKPISPCAGRQCYSDAGSRFRIAYLFQNSNVR